MEISRTQPNHSTHNLLRATDATKKHVKNIIINIRKKFLFCNIFLI